VKPGMEVGVPRNRLTSILLALVFLASCAAAGTPHVTAASSQSMDDPAGRSTSGSTLVVVPTPVPAGADSTTITWSVADGAVGQVYVSVNGGTETLVAEGLEGSQEGPRISSGATYEFRLYLGTKRAALLATTTVTRQ
jgi:hypothetical protein